MFGSFHAPTLGTPSAMAFLIESPTPITVSAAPKDTKVSYKLELKVTTVSKGFSNVTSLPAESVIVIPVDCTTDEAFISPEVLLLPPLVPQAVKLTAIVAKSTMQSNFVFIFLPSFNQILLYFTACNFAAV